jgi:hypothetical protein
MNVQMSTFSILSQKQDPPDQTWNVLDLTKKIINDLIPQNNVVRVVFESGSIARSIGANAFESKRVEEIRLERSVKILKSECFRWCSSLKTITFEPQSKLQRIESKAFLFVLIWNRLRFRTRLKFFIVSVFINANHCSRSHLNHNRNGNELNQKHFLSLVWKKLKFHLQLQLLMDQHLRIYH